MGLLIHLEAAPAWPRWPVAAAESERDEADEGSADWTPAWKASLVSFSPLNRSPLAITDLTHPLTPAEPDPLFRIPALRR